MYMVEIYVLHSVRHKCRAKTHKTYIYLWSSTDIFHIFHIFHSFITRMTQSEELWFGYKLSTSRPTPNDIYVMTYIRHLCRHIYVVLYMIYTSYSPPRPICPGAAPSSVDGWGDRARAPDSSSSPSRSRNHIICYCD